MSEALGGADFAAMAAKGDAADVFAKPLPAGIVVAGLAASLSRALFDSRSSPAFVAVWPFTSASFVLASAASDPSASSRGRLFFGLVPACAFVSAGFGVFLFGDAISASASSILETELAVGLAEAPPSRSFVVSLDRFRACPSGLSEDFSSLSCFLSGCLSPSLSSSMSSRLRFLRNRPRSLSDPEALRLPGFRLPLVLSVAVCPESAIGFAVASMLVFWNFSRTGRPSLSLLLSLRAGETAACATSGTVSCCSDELIVALLSVGVFGLAKMAARVSGGFEEV